LFFGFRLKRAPISVAGGFLSLFVDLGVAGIMGWRHFVLDSRRTWGAGIYALVDFVVWLKALGAGARTVGRPYMGENEPVSAGSQHVGAAIGWIAVGGVADARASASGPGTACAHYRLLALPVHVGCGFFGEALQADVFAATAAVWVDRKCLGRLRRFTARHFIF